jgi:hypothetical protein
MDLGAVEEWTVRNAEQLAPLPHSRERLLVTHVDGQTVRCAAMDTFLLPRSVPYDAYRFADFTGKFVFHHISSTRRRHDGGCRGEIAVGPRRSKRNGLGPRVGDAEGAGRVHSHSRAVSRRAFLIVAGGVTSRRRVPGHARAKATPPA